MLKHLIYIQEGEPGRNKLGGGMKPKLFAALAAITFVAAAFGLSIACTSVGADSFMGVPGGNNIPVLDPHTIPVLDPHSIPVLDPHTIPVLDPHTIPVLDPHTIPVLDPHTIPVLDPHAIPVLDPH